MARVMQAQPGEAPAQARGMQVILLLAVLTLVEYGIALALRSSSVALVVLLTPIALVKAWVIAMYFMHVTRVWRGEEEQA